jgi:hypothetical protein
MEDKYQALIRGATEHCLLAQPADNTKNPSKFKPGQHIVLLLSVESDY